MQRVLFVALKGVEKETAEKLKKAGIETLEDLKLAPIPQAIQRTGLSEEQLGELLSRAELRAYGVPPEVADALVSSGAIRRAGELAAFDAEELQSILRREVEAKRADASLDLSVEAIAAWKAGVPRLALDEEMTASPSFEAETKALCDEAEAGGHAEDTQVTAPQLEQTLSQMRGALRQGEAILKELSQSKEGTVELTTVQHVIASVHEQITDATQSLMPETILGAFVAVGEDDVPAAAEEALDTEVQIRALTERLKDIEGQLAELQARRVIGDEDLSPSAAAEEEFEAPRGEEESND